jgi:ATP-dependent exoDNAse (exonuclease V) beta subunit
LGAAAARRVGTAIHRVLEEFDFNSEPESELQRHRDCLSQDLSQNVLPGERKAALAAGQQLLDRMVVGKLFTRLRALADRVVAQELPVLLPPGDDDAAIDYLVGSIDLVYRDPESDELVVADYKTDSLSDGESLHNRITSYARQGAVYQRAIRESLDLPYTPRFELWFLDLDRIVTVPASTTGEAAP